MVERLRSLDLFSGIGGNALALRSVLNPIAYCEIDPFATSVLGCNMDRDALDRAPVFPDVTTLAASDVPGIPDVITASFPCQDISASGMRAGLTGEHSSLVWEVMRLVDEFDRLKKRAIRAVLLENSPCIEHRGLPEILAALKKRGFRACWGIFAARDVGASHIRKRWFCVAVRRGAASSPVLKREALHHFDFDRLDATPRLVAKASCVPDVKTGRTRISALGNAVVPSVTRLAWNELCRELRKRDPEEKLSRCRDCEPREPMTLVFEDGVTYQWWSTPVHTPTHWYPQPEFRGRMRQMLANRVFHEADTKRAFGYKSVDVARAILCINPVWVEVLMGYAPNWTSCL
jgi:site-specific DNA-cytosine methylase